MNEAKAVHLFNLAHYSAFTPFLGRHAVALDQYAYENGINVPMGYSHCERCGIYHVPGLTSSARVVYVKKTDKRAVLKSTPRRREFHVRCLACQYVKVHQTLISKKMAPVTVAGGADHSTGDVVGAKTGKKKKKSKRSELLAMLADKKKAAAALLLLLSLFEFMQ